MEIDPGLILRKRLHAEMEVLCDIVKKAELAAERLVGKNGSGGAPPDRFIRGRFSEVEACMEGERISRAKKRKTMPMAKNLEPVMLPRKDANNGMSPRYGHSKEPRMACIKKRKMKPAMDIIKSRAPKRHTIARCVSSPSAKTLMHNEKKDVATVYRPPIGSPSPHQLEEGEITEEEEDFVNICGGVSPVPKVCPSSPLLLEDDKTEEENVLVDKCGEASWVSSLLAKTPTLIEKKDASNMSSSLISRRSYHQLEEGEIVEEEDDFVDICGDVSLVPTVHPWSQLLAEDDETKENMLVDKCGEASRMLSHSAKTPTHIEKKDVVNMSRSPISRPSHHQLEEGEIVEEEKDDFVDICGGVSLVPTVRAWSPLLLEDDETEEDNMSIDICGEASPVAAQKLSEAINSSSSSSSRSSGSSCSDSSDSESSGSSGSSSSDESDSDNSSSSEESDSDNRDSDNTDNESVESSPTPKFPRKVDNPLVLPAQEFVRASPF